MQYYQKIEAYFEDKLSAVERLVFEQELAENPILQKEFHAYETAHSLFDFAGNNLPSEEIIADSAEKTAGKLIDYTAKNLTTAEIIAIPNAKPQAIVRSINPTPAPVFWLVAASLLALLTIVGIRFYAEQDNKALNNVAAVEKIIPESIETEKIIPPQPTTLIAKKTPAPVKQKRQYEPAKITRREKPVQTLEMPLVEPISPIVQTVETKKTVRQIALNTKATTLSTNSVIDKDNSVVYEAKESITLKAGFHAKAGAAFTAKPIIKKEVLQTAAIIESQKSVQLQAESIVLKPGFHAKAGTSFTAKTKKAEIASETNAIINATESVTIKSESVITLKPGFHAKAGATFTAKVK